MEVIRTILRTSKLRLAGTTVSRAAAFPTRPRGIIHIIHRNARRASQLRHGSIAGWGMDTAVNDTAIDEIVAACNGDIRGALKALMLVNEQLEAELQQLHAVVAHGAAAERGSSALH